MTSKVERKRKPKHSKYRNARTRKYDEFDSSSPIKKSESLNLNNDILQCGSISDRSRLNGISVCCPILYGNVSYRQERAPEHPSTSRFNNDRETSDNSDWFRWTVYVRGLQNEDISYFVQKVVFYIHDTYFKPIRVIEQPPFELTEEGWGQFDIKIEIYFHDVCGSIEMIDDQQQMQETADQPLLFANEMPLHFAKIKESKIENIQKSADFNLLTLTAETLRKLELEKESEVISMFSDMNGISNCAPVEDTESHKSLSANVYENKAVIVHGLRLFERPGVNENNTKQEVIEEKYTEIVFVDPFYGLYKKLIQGPFRYLKEHPFQRHWKRNVQNIAEQEQSLMHRIHDCHTSLLQDIQIVNEKYAHVNQLLMENESKQDSKVRIF